MLIIHHTELAPPNAHGKGNGLSGCRVIGAPLTLIHRRSVACFGSLGALARYSDKPTVHVKFLATRSGGGTSTTCTLFAAMKRRSISLGFNFYGTQFPCFWNIPMALRRLEIVCLVTPNDSANSSYVLYESPASNASNSESSKMFSFPPPCQYSTSKLSLLKRWNHSRHVLSLRAVLP